MMKTQEIRQLLRNSVNFMERINTVNYSSIEHVMKSKKNGIKDGKSLSNAGHNLNTDGIQNKYYLNKIRMFYNNSILQLYPAQPLPLIKAIKFGKGMHFYDSSCAECIFQKRKYSTSQKKDVQTNGNNYFEDRQECFENFLYMLNLFINLYHGHRRSEKRHADDIIFDMFSREETNLLCMEKFLATLKSTGIRTDDPRISELMKNLQNVHKSSNSACNSAESQTLDRETFKCMISSNIDLISRAIRHQFIIPDFKSFTKDIDMIYYKCKSNTEGKVANYIPELAKYDPSYWGISICTVDGQRHSIGDVNIPFLLESCSKPLTYGIALEKLGQEVVHKYVGQEPSGRNPTELVLDYNKQPHNAMINTGAIVICALLKSLIEPEMTVTEKFDYTQEWFKRLAAGGNFGFNNTAFLEEREAGDRNYALGYYMREHNCFPENTNLVEVIDFYLQCCCMEANCEIMATVAATLANGGVCPLTEEKVFRPDVVRDVLSVMHSCGMYDLSGEFSFKVGMPTKSGVCGGMLIIVPNVMGIFAWSPLLEPLGNSVRGLQFCNELTNYFNFHPYDNLKNSSDKKDPRTHRYESKGLSVVGLLYSAANGDITALKRLKLSGMDFALSDYYGRTALHLAASEGHLDCVKFLLGKCHVPCNPKDRWGNEPFDEAETFGHQEVLNYLKEWNGKTVKGETSKEFPEKLITTNTKRDKEIQLFPKAINSLETESSEKNKPEI